MNGLKPTPWDKRTFHIDTYEVIDINEDTLKLTDELEGHYTLKIDPLTNHQIVHEHGFYYVDSLIEPRCNRENLQLFHRNTVFLTNDYEPEKLLDIAATTFEHGRFHRDFNIPNKLADERYMRWVKDLIDEDCMYALVYDEKEVGFYGFKDDAVLLLSIDPAYQGAKLAKPFTSMAVKKQFQQGYDQLKTSISAANLKSLNLFLQLGFTLHKTVDVYHKLNSESLKDV
ncbi:N-acetyltransferase [Pseudogracilibacillus sp. SE30717A]|uniref:N-acetyltransferase n=1 Tax=Pseudogracilibacillus sp. SE30717A TaxID=3098293 RepID=UPI00300E1E08